MSRKLSKEQCEIFIRRFTSYVENLKELINEKELKNECTLLQRLMVAQYEQDIAIIRARLTDDRI